MIRLTALSEAGWRDMACGSIAEARRLWAEQWSQFGILSLAESPLDQPTPWQSVAGYLLATPAFLDQHAPNLHVVRYTDGSLPVVTDDMFVPAKWDPVRRQVVVPSLGAMPGGRVRRPPLSPPGTLSPGHPLLDGPVTLLPDTPLSDLPGMQATAVRAVIDWVGAVTVGDLMRLKVEDVTSKGRPAFTGQRNARLIRRVLSPWKVPEASRPRPVGDTAKGESLVDGSYPDWFLATPVTALRLPHLLGIALSSCDTIADLAATDVTRVTRTNGLGVAAINRLRARIAQEYVSALALRTGTRKAAAVPKPVVERTWTPYDVTQPFLDHVVEHRDLFTDREGKVVRACFGIDGPLRTPGDLMAALGIGEARIRQIRVEGLDRLNAASGCLRTLGEALASVSERPVPLDAVMDMPWTAGMPKEVLEWLLARCADLSIVTLSPGVEVVTSMPRILWPGHRRILSDILASAAPGDGTEAILRRYRVRLGAMRHAEAAIALARMLVGERRTPTVEAAPPESPRVRWSYPETRKPRTSTGMAFLWTPDAEATLRRMVGEGRSSREIRDVLGGGLTKNAISGKVHRLGLAVPRKPRD